MRSRNLTLLSAVLVAACVGRIEGVPETDGDGPRPADAAGPSVPFVPADATGSDAAAPGADAGEPPDADPAAPGPDASGAGPDAAAPGADAAAPGPDAAAPGPDASTTCPSLANRVQVSAIDVSPAQVSVGSSWSWASNDMVIVQPLANGRSRVAWSDGTNVHITPLDVGLARAGADVTVAGNKLRGFYAHEDGRAAVGVERGDSIFLVGFDAAGTKQWETTVVGPAQPTTAGSKWVDSWGDQARLVWDGTQYALYLGHTMFWGAQGKHQGDLLRYYSAAGAAAGGYWDWGCSHSLDLRMAADGSTLYPVCLSDCYPEKAILLNHYTNLRSEPSGNCSGYSHATLGGLAVNPGKGAALSFVSDEGRQGHDVGLVVFDSSGTQKTTSWLTTTPTVEESNSHLARYGADLLASWEEGSGTTKLAVVKTDGTILDGPVAVSAHAELKDDFVTTPGGDVMWGWGNGSTLEIARVRNCR